MKVLHIISLILLLFNTIKLIIMTLHGKIGNFILLHFSYSYYYSPSLSHIHTNTLSNTPPFCRCKLSNQHLKHVQNITETKIQPKLYSLRRRKKKYAERNFKNSNFYLKR